MHSTVKIEFDSRIENAGFARWDWLDDHGTLPVETITITAAPFNDTIRVVEVPIYVFGDHKVIVAPGYSGPRMYLLDFTFIQGHCRWFDLGGHFFLPRGTNPYDEAAVKTAWDAACAFFPNGLPAERGL